MALNTSMTIEELLEILGYGAGLSSRKKLLVTELDVFFRNYLAKGNVIPDSAKHRSPLAVECAVQFLQENARAESYWPLNAKDVVAWSTHEQLITEAVGHIIRRKAISHKACEHQRAERYSTKNMAGTKRKRKRNENRVPKSEKREVLKKTTMKTWNQPPKVPSTTSCTKYMVNLDPEEDEKLVSFSKEWLTQINAPWPTGANSRLERFMHQENFYITSVDQGISETPKSIRFSKLLRIGTEIEDINKQDTIVYMRRFFDQIKRLSLKLAGDPFFFLEFSHEGTVQKTSKFERVWTRRDEFWQVVQAATCENFGDESSQPVKRVSRDSQSRISDRPVDVTSETAGVQGLGGRSFHSPASAAPSATEQRLRNLSHDHVEDIEMVDTPDISAPSSRNGSAAVGMIPDRGSPVASTGLYVSQVSLLRSEGSAERTMTGHKRSFSNSDKIQRKKSLVLKLRALPHAPSTSLPPSSTYTRGLGVKMESPGASTVLVRNSAQLGSTADIPISFSDDESGPLGGDAEQQDMLEEGQDDTLLQASKKVWEMCKSWKEDRHPSRQGEIVDVPNTMKNNLDRSCAAETPTKDSLSREDPHVASAPNTVTVFPAISTQVQLIFNQSTISVSTATSIPTAKINQDVPSNPTPPLNSFKPALEQSRPVKSCAPKGPPQPGIGLEVQPKPNTKDDQSKPTSLPDLSNSVREQVLDLPAAESASSDETAKIIDTILNNRGNVHEQLLHSWVKGVALDSRSLEDSHLQVSAKNDQDKAAENHTSPQKTYQEKVLDLKDKLASTSSSPRSQRNTSPLTDKSITSPTMRLPPTPMLPFPKLHSSVSHWGNNPFQEQTLQKESTASQEPGDLVPKEPTPASRVFSAASVSGTGATSQHTSPTSTITTSKTDLGTKTYITPYKPMLPTPCLPVQVQHKIHESVSTTSKTNIERKKNVVSVKPGSAADFVSAQALNEHHAYVNVRNNLKAGTKTDDLLGKPKSPVLSPQADFYQKHPRIVSDAGATGIKSSPLPKRPTFPIPQASQDKILEPVNTRDTKLDEPKIATPLPRAEIPHPDTSANKTLTETKKGETQTETLVEELKTPAPLPQIKDSQPEYEQECPVLPGSSNLSPITNTAMLLKHNSPYAIIPVSSPFSTKPSESDQPLVPATEPNLERRLKPISQRDPNAKTLELVIELEDGTIDCDTDFTFQVAEDNTLFEFFDFYSTVSRVPIFRLNKLILRLAFGKGQDFTVQRTGDAIRNEQLWKKTKNIIRTLYKSAQKADKNETDFQVLVQMG